MKRFIPSIFLCFLTVVFSAATRQSKQNVYLQLTDAAGQTIRGTSVNRGYERQIIVTAFSGYATGNPQLTFSMPSGGATATLANLQGGKERLPSALFTVTEMGADKQQVVSTLRLEEVAVVSVSDAAGTTEVTLRAARTGATYFQHNRKTGVQTVSGKAGYDFTLRTAWTNF